MSELLSMGPPLYWVLDTALPMSAIENQNLICGGQGKWIKHSTNLLPHIVIQTNLIIDLLFLLFKYSLLIQGCNQDSVVTKLYMASTNAEMYV